MDFKFLQNPLTNKWVVLAPRRARRPDEAKGTADFCPFCVGSEEESEVYRVGGDKEWKVRVVNNKFPFAPIHEIIVHSPDHNKNIEDMENSEVELIFQTFRQRFETHKDKGHVFIFSNHGEKGGESLPHPHTQLAVVPKEVNLDIPRLARGEEILEVTRDQVVVETEYFQLFCPKTSQWPDEVWVHPKLVETYFYEIPDEVISDLSMIVKRLIKILSVRHKNELPYNFYIYPGRNWYLRLIPRDKGLGGFEVGAGIYVNTQDPTDTIKFIKENFEKDGEMSEAEYGRSA